MKTIKVGEDPQLTTIDGIYAFLSIQDGKEGVCAFLGPTGFMPMVSADQKVIQSLIPLAEQISRDHGFKIELVRFSTRFKIREFERTSS